MIKKTKPVKNEHFCKKLEKENAGRKLSYEHQIYIFQDMYAEMEWFTKCGSEYVPSNFCPFCGEKLDA